jgi:hypothetical protein
MEWTMCVKKEGKLVGWGFVLGKDDIGYYVVSLSYRPTHALM